MTVLEIMRAVREGTFAHPSMGKTPAMRLRAADIVEGHSTSQDRKLYAHAICTSCIIRP